LWQIVIVTDVNVSACGSILLQASATTNREHKLYKKSTVAKHFYSEMKENYQTRIIKIAITQKVFRRPISKENIGKKEKLEFYVANVRYYF
jgi:hypothetical protein